MGGNAAVAHAYGCTITIPEGEVKHVVPWTPQSAWMAKFDQRADPFHFDATIAAGDAFEGGGFEWQAHAAPGHDMDALMFFEPRAPHPDLRRRAVGERHGLRLAGGRRRTPASRRRARRWPRSSASIPRS